MEATAVHRLPRPRGTVGRPAGERSPGAAHPRTPGAVRPQGPWVAQPIGQRVRRARLGAARGTSRCTSERRPQLGVGPSQRYLVRGLRCRASIARRQPTGATDHRVRQRRALRPRARSRRVSSLRHLWCCAGDSRLARSSLPAPLDVVGERLEEQSGETTHLSVVDKDGNAVALTQTNSSVWGSGGFVRGYFLNDSGFRFTDENIDRALDEPLANQDHDDRADHRAPGRQRADGRRRPRWRPDPD